MSRHRVNVLSWVFMVLASAFLLAADENWTDRPTDSGAANAAAVLYDNGPFITHPGGGYGGADLSLIQQSLGMANVGEICGSLKRIADEFTVTEVGGWDVESIVFYAIWLDIKAVNYRIWNGVPDAVGSGVIFGDTTTNRLTNSTFTNVYRARESNILSNSWPVMANTVSAGFHLDPGTYWIDMQTSNVTSSIAITPDITILGTAVTGNALTEDTVAGPWYPATNYGKAQGIPFILNGTVIYTVQITSISSRTGKSGSTATIRGSGFSATKTKNIVYFGTKKARINRARTTKLTVTIPRLKKGLYDVHVVVDGSPSNTVQFQVK